jgi:HEAT repeat protein
MGHCTAGDEHAVYFLIPQLWHEDSLVRQDALVTLKRLVPKGNAEVLQRIEGGAFSAEPSMRIMAIYALSELADADDNVTAALLEDLLLDQHDAVVCAATCAVANMAPRGHAHAIDLLLTNCHDMSEAVRRVSIQARPTASRHTQFSCFTSTKVQILTPEELGAARVDAGAHALIRQG